MPEYHLMMRLYDGITLTCALKQTFYVQKLDFSPIVFDEPRLLQCVRNHSHASAPDAEHLCKIFLGEKQCIATGQITGAQKPSAKPCFDLMICHAGRGLLCL